MHSHISKLIFLINAFLFFFIRIYAQNEPGNLPGENQKISGVENGLFNTDELLHFKLTGKLNELFTDRKDNMKYHPLLLQYQGKDSNVISIKIKAKARGNFRRLKENCKLPPLMLNFPKEDKLKNTLFTKQDKLKLVIPCQDEEYVVREWLVYELYNLITEKSFRARLAKVDFEDSLKQRKPESFYCILIEDENEVAERNKAVLVEKKLQMENTNRREFTKMAVFEYMIANTDWSVPYLQNIKLISTDQTLPPYAVPYDFDHAGIVNARYAGAAPELGISSITERIYRGYCDTDRMDFLETFELFNKKKDDIYNLYTNCSLLDSRYVKFVTRFLDSFFKTINNVKSIDEVFNAPCRTNIRIELKGLKD